MKTELLYNYNYKFKIIIFVLLNFIKSKIQLRDSFPK